MVVNCAEVDKLNNIVDVVNRADKCFLLVCYSIDVVVSVQHFSFRTSSSHLLAVPAPSLSLVPATTIVAPT